MLSWGVIGYGAALSAVAATVLVGLAGHEHKPAVLAAASAVLGAIGWNAILHATHVSCRLIGNTRMGASWKNWSALRRGG